MSRFARRQPIGAVSGLFLIVILGAAVFANIIAPYDPIENRVGPALSSPSAGHLAGTDQFGRDILSRLIYGARTSVIVGISATLLGVVMATVLGSVSGFKGGWIDYIVQRLVDTAQAIPPLILLVGVVVVLGPSMTNVILALALRTGLSMSRITRGAVMSLKEEQYIQAARSMGATETRILLHHVLPNIASLVIVLMSTVVGTLIVAEASLSFLGFGVPPPTPSWGGMMSKDGRTYMLIAPWMLIGPTVALSVVVFATNMLGDALRDELDPRMKK